MLPAVSSQRLLQVALPLQAAHKTRQNVSGYKGHLQLVQPETLTELFGPVQ